MVNSQINRGVLKVTMRGILTEETSPSHTGDEDGDSEEFAVRFAKAFVFLEAVELASSQSAVKMTQRSPGQENATRGQSNGTDHRDSCLEEELDNRLERMTEIARKLRGACARKRDHIAALCAGARRCHDDCVRLFADMTRHFRSRLSAYRKQVARMGEAMASVENRNMELNKAFGEMLARATCTIDDLGERLEHTRTELSRGREENDTLRRRVASLEKANRTAQQQTALALARLQDSDDRAKEAQDKLESAEKVSRYYELLLDASLRKLCLYEDSDELSRKTSTDSAPDHVCGAYEIDCNSAIKEETKILPEIGGRNWNMCVRARAASVSGWLERTVGRGSFARTNTGNHGPCHRRATSEAKNNDYVVTDVIAMTDTSMTSLDTTGELSLPLVGLSRRKGENACNAADVDSSMTSLLSEQSPIVPKKRTKKKRRLTRQLRKSFSLEEADQMEADIASMKTNCVRRKRSSSSTDAADLLNECHDDVMSGKPTSREDLASGRDPAKTEDNVSGLPPEQDSVIDDATSVRDRQTNDLSTVMSKDTSPGQNKPKRTGTFKGLKISGNAGFASFVRDVQRKLRRPRRSKTVELADLIGVREPESDSLNGDCNV